MSAGRIRTGARLLASAPFDPAARERLRAVASRVKRAAVASRVGRVPGSLRWTAGLLTADARGALLTGRVALLSAQTRLRGGDPDGALAILDGAERDGNSSAASLILRAEALRRLGRHEEALLAARAAAARAPSSPRVAKMAGVVALAAGDVDEARRQLDMAAQRRPGDASVRYNRAQAMLRGGRMQDALSEISAAVAIAPDEPAYLRALGDILRRASRRDDALQTLERALALRPRSAAAVEAFAAALVEAGREADAQNLVDERIAEDLRARVMARAYITLKRYEEALPFIDEAIKRGPQNAWNHFLRFNALKGIGDLSGAMTSLREARAAGDDPRFRAHEAQLKGLMRTFTDGWVPLIAGEPERLQAAAPNRILHLLERTAPHRLSGYTVRSQYTVKAQRDTGLDPVVATRLGFPAIDGTTTFDPIDVVEGVPHHRLTLPGEVNYARFPKDEYLERYAQQAGALVERLRPAVVQPASSYFNALVGLALKRRYGVPMVYEVRGFQEDSWASRRQDAAGTEYYEGRYRAEALCMREADRVVTLAEVMRSEIVERGVDPNRIAVIPNAVDVERFTPRLRDRDLARSLDLDDHIVLGYISSLSNYEGVDILLRGIRCLLDRGRDVRGLVVGDGPELEPLRALVAELGLMEHVQLTGRVPHDRVLDYYSLIDVFVVPRRDLRVCQLVTPLKPFEAMAMGIPLLVSDVTALREVASPGERGLAFTPEDPESLAEQAEILVADEALRRRFGEAAREWVGRERTWARNAERYRALYEELLAERGVRLSAPARMPGVEVVPLERHERIPESNWATLHGPNDAPRVGEILTYAWSGRVLEIGSGRGYVSCQIAAGHGGQIDVLVGAEPVRHLANQSRLLAALNDVKGYAPVAAFGERLPFASRTFDWVLVSEVLEHVHEPLPIMREAARVLSPGGMALLTVPSYGALPPSKVPGHVQDYTEEEFRALIADAGLAVAAHSTVAVFEFYLVTRAH